MHIIAVDDERLVLQGMERVIKEALPGCTPACFDTPEAVLAYAKENPVDVAFIDVRMPGMNGLALAVALKKIRHTTNIIFATAYKQYQGDALNMHVSGYILKPAKKEDVLREIENLRHPVARVQLGKRLRVQTFGNFEVFVDGKPLKLTSRAKQLFAYLVDANGASVTSAEFAAAIWEDREYDRSLRNQIQAAISEMMKALQESGCADVIRKEWNKISVDTAKISCDYYDLLNWDVSTVNAFCGKYMAQYSWAEMTAAALSQKTKIL